MKAKHLAFVAIGAVVLLLVLLGVPITDSLTVGTMMAAPGALVDRERIIKGLREERGDKLDEMTAILEKAEGESRDFTEAEETDYNKLKSEADKLEARAVRLEDLFAKEKEAAKIKGAQAEKREKKQGKEEDEKRYSQVFWQYARRGFARMKEEDISMVEERAMSVGTGSEGGYTVPQGFSGKLEEALLTLGGVRSVADVLTTATGNKIPYPTVNDTNNEGEIINENIEAGDSKEPTFGTVDIDAYTYSSKPILVSNQLLQDSAFDLEGFLARTVAQRIFRITNKHFTIGTGVGQPKGAVVASFKGADAAATAITYDNLIDLFHSVDSAYRLNASWMFSDNTLKAIKKLKDNDGKPIWQAGLVSGDPSTIMGKPYIINDNCPDIATGKKSILFGDFKKYLIRDVMGASLMRLRERYADKNQTAFILFSRHDGKLIDAGTHPIKHMLHA